MNNAFGKKHYQMVADTISLIENGEKRDELIDFFSHMFKTDNERFDKDRFIEWIQRRLDGKSMKGMKHNPKYMPRGN